MNLKEVALADGQLRFRVPAGWVESVEEDGGAAFSDETGEQGTLRVKLMTFTTADDLSGHRAVAELEAMEAEPGQTLEGLPNGNAVRFHRESAPASGEPTAFHVWLLASIDPPHRLRLAVFSFTTRTIEGGVLATLNAEIRQARFAHQLS